jgi:hypothetical protein
MASLKELSVSIPELYGVLFLVKLVKKPASELNYYSSKIYLWTDSDIILIYAMQLSVGIVRSRTQTMEFFYAPERRNSHSLPLRVCVWVCGWVGRKPTT